MNALSQKAKEVIQSVVPIVLLVLGMHVTLVPLDKGLLISFLIGSLFVIIGLTIFLIGVDLSITPIAEYLGKGIIHSNKLWIVLLVSVGLGFFTSAAEPSLGVLANQIEAVTSGAMPASKLLVVVASGVAFTLTIAVLRSLYNISIIPILYGIFGAIFVLAYFSTSEFFSIGFDASGATTGALAVPFFLSLSTGIASLKKGSKESEEASFGLVGIASSGAVLAILLLSVLSENDTVSGSLPEIVAQTGSLFSVYIAEIQNVTGGTFKALLPIVLIFVVFHYFAKKLKQTRLRKIGLGLVYSFVGLVLFLTGVNAGFMDVGTALGQGLAEGGNAFYMVTFSFILGVVTILAEPAVSVLVQQIEEVTGGAIKRPLILTSLSLGVGLAIAGAMLRILIPALQLWHFIVPGYILALGLSLFVPKVFVGMAFDAGSVSSGPIAATFILAFVQGAAESISTADVILDGFGMIAMVAMMPIILLQVVGLIYGIQSKAKTEPTKVESS